MRTLFVALALLLMSMASLGAEKHSGSMMKTDPATGSGINSSALGRSGTGNFPRRNYFITAAPQTGATSLSACGSGYHMASVWELRTTTNLYYAANHPLAWHNPAIDFGGGFPLTGEQTGSFETFWYVPFGFVRTDTLANMPHFHRTMNCNIWTSNSPKDGASVAGFIPVNTGAYWQTPYSMVEFAFFDGTRRSDPPLSDPADELPLFPCNGIYVPYADPAAPPEGQPASIKIHTWCIAD